MTYQHVPVRFEDCGGSGLCGSPVPTSRIFHEHPLGYMIGRLEAHTVREEDDDTISVRPGDGSSNSILITGARGRQWHGFIEHGVWRPC